MLRITKKIYFFLIFPTLYRNDHEKNIYFFNVNFSHGKEFFLDLNVNLYYFFLSIFKEEEKFSEQMHPKKFRHVCGHEEKVKILKNAYLK